MNNQKNILIIGGTGFIGYHLATKALKKDWHVTSVSTKKPKKKRFLRKVRYIYCDISNKKKLNKKIKKNYHYVVNLGGYVDHSNKKKTYESHYLGCKNLTEIFLKKKIKAFVQIGSSIEYGAAKSPQSEINRCNPKSVYGKAKLSSSRHLINLFKKRKFPSIVLRLYQVYGPKQDLNRFIPIIISGCLKNKKFACSDGIQYRDFTHVSDVVNAIFLSLKNKKARGQILNIGSGKPRKIKNIIIYIQRFLKGGFPMFGKIKLRKDEILKVYPNISKVKKKIDWKPKIPFEKGLISTIKSYSEKNF